VEGALKLPGLDEAGDLPVFRKLFQHRRADVLAFQGPVEAADEERVIVEQDGKERSAAPFFIELRKLAIAVVPEGEIHPENRRVSGAPAQRSFGRGHLVQGLLRGLRRRTKEKGLSTPDLFDAGPEEIYPHLSGKKKAFSRQRLPDQKPIAERKKVLDQALQGLPGDFPPGIQGSN